MQAPDQPWNYEISRFDQGCCDEGKGGGNEPHEYEADMEAAVTVEGAFRWKTVLETLTDLFAGFGGRARWQRWRLHVWKTTESGDGGPGGDEVDWDDEVSGCGVAEEEAEDVEGVVTVIGQGEGVNDGIVADDESHEGNDGYCDFEARELVSGGAGSKGHG